VNKPELLASVYRPPAALKPWALRDVVGHGNLLFFSLARWALVEALRLCGAEEKTVLLPDFICRDVLASLKQAGAKAAFYPVNENLEAELPVKNLPPAAAVVAVNYFGFPQNLEPFRLYCRQSGAVLIEDNAHGLFSRDPQGAALGTRAPLGLLSLRKTMALSDGGVLLVNDAGLSALASAQTPAAAKPHPSLSFLKKRELMRKISGWLGPKGMHSAIAAMRYLRKIKTGSKLPGASADGERIIPADAPPSREAIGPYAAADAALESRRRRDLYEFCDGLLASSGAQRIFRLDKGVCPYAYPFRALGPALKKTEDILGRYGLFSLPWPDLPDAVAAKPAPHLTNVRLVQFLW
jgi:hypothetical protein